MTAPRVVLALVFVVVASSIGVGATTPTSTPTPADEPATMGASISAFMAANAAQTSGSVETGMWVAAYARASNDSERRALVEARVGSMNATVAELQADRRELNAAYRNGSLNQTVYRARLATLVGQLAALGESIETADDRGRAVGVNTSRLDELRSQARELGGGAVSAAARNLTGGQAPPGRAGVFGEDRPGPPADRGPTSERPGQSDDDGQGPPTDREPGPPAGNATTTASPPADEY
jgi:hypothetical protein